ncbi:Predicted metal-dependent phosphohydrolase, HD superfamily [Algoriphagus faecimaris]|uniref:Predicted metal-dependent phosphohydrolase, HD superfamily n=1 Tax=Algoriphagus faecimaris TaxID=686796 RepID=A0A1G6Q907_9BACT|nr:HD domain-containing protein [Algoriphagus faecimaris]SDC88970.1 Predicted metal-dependent phosphohydrolase, HD superfamily [Algoriphagus faecimaris]
MDFEELKHKVFRDILKRLPSYLTYHNLTHTEYVMEKSEFLARIAKVSEEELQLLKIAALFHDTGFIENPKNHEEIGCRIAQEYLKDAVSESDLNKIFGMIMATKIPQSPRNELEKIIADADLEYLGTDQFEIQGNALYEELKHFNPELSETQWNELQLSFLEKHQYHTDFCKKYREPTKQENLLSVKTKLGMVNS